MYKLVKFVTLFVLCLGLYACGQKTPETAVSENAATQSPAYGSDISVVEVANAEVHPAGYFNYGQTPSSEEIAGWDIDIRPDGQGLPVGSGSVEDGESLYDEQCASCHGSFGEGAKGYPVLAGGQGTLIEARPEKTIGSYWAHASTLWDYIHRAMPFQAPESLEDDEVYALTAYVLYLNELVEDDFVLSNENFTTVEMPNKDGFYLDDRPDVQAERCMQNCKEYKVEITSEPANQTLEIETDKAPAIPATASVAGAALGAETYQAACAMCHDSGVAGAPVTGDAAQWTDRISKGAEVLGNSAINGLGAMPAKGGQTQLSDEAVLAAVSYMLETSE